MPTPKSSIHGQELFGSSFDKSPERYVVTHIDGGARGNPGPAGYGVVLEDERRHRIVELSEYLGRQTNNYAEYSGLLAALNYAVQHGFKALKVVSDSELLVRQLNGIYKVRDPRLRELYDRAQSLIRKLDWFRAEHVPREQNRDADRLANQAMDKGSSLAHRASAASAAGAAPDREMNGVVRNGVIELMDGTLPEGARVKVKLTH